MNDTRTIGSRNIVIANYIECFFLELAHGIVIERFIFAVFEVLALVLFEDFAFAFDTFKDRVHESFGHVVNRAVNLDFHVIHFRIHAEAEVGRQRPRSRRPGEEVSIFVFYLELNHGRTLFDVLIALGYFVGRQRGAAARAVRNDLMALVEQALLPDFLECPPFGFNEVIFVGDVGMFHISPEANHIREFFPHALVLPNGFTALLDERLDAVFFNLFLAIDAHELFDFKLYRQAVGIPASLAQNLLALHGLITRQHILDNARQHMTDMRLAVSRRRAIIKRKGITAFTLVNRLLRDVILLPEIQNFLFSVHEVQIGVNLAVQTNSSSKIQKTCIPKTGCRYTYTYKPPIFHVPSYAIP